FCVHTLGTGAHSNALGHLYFLHHLTGGALKAVFFIKRIAHLAVGYITATVAATTSAATRAALFILEASLKRLGNNIRPFFALGIFLRLLLLFFFLPFLKLFRQTASFFCCATRSLFFSFLARFCFLLANRFFSFFATLFRFFTLSTFFRRFFSRSRLSCLFLLTLLGFCLFACLRFGLQTRFFLGFLTCCFFCFCF